MHFSIPETMFVMKNGSQQMMNTPITVPRVLAAFFSLANLFSLRDREKLLGLEMKVKRLT